MGSITDRPPIYERPRISPRTSTSTVTFNDSSYTLPDDAYKLLSLSPQPSHPMQSNSGPSPFATILNLPVDILNRMVTPEQRSHLFDRAKVGARAHPHLTALIVLNLLFSGPAVLIFALTVTSTAAFALFWGLLLGLLGAGAVIAVVVGLGLCILVPVLCFTVFAAVTVWFWGCLGWWVFEIVSGWGKEKGGVVKDEDVGPRKGKELLVVKEVKR